MKQLELLEILKTNQMISLLEWLKQGGDYNSKIRRKTLLEHALINKAHDCANVLLLWGANGSGLKDLLKEQDDFLKMIEDTVVYSRSSNFRIQLVLDELSSMILGKKPFSYRDVMSFDGDQRKLLFCGLHHFEYVDWDFLTISVKDSFKCNTGIGKFALVVSAVMRSKMGELPPVSERITAFLKFQEVPAENLQDVLDEMIADEDELYIGTHYSEYPSIIPVGDEALDISSQFFDSMKDAICAHKAPVTFKSTHTFANIVNWSHELHRSVTEFKSRNGVYPNIVLAAGITYSRIDLVANSNGSANIKGGDGNVPLEPVPLCGFQGPDYCLEFCVDDRLELNVIKLIFDHGPGGGGEPISENLQKASGV